MYHVMSTFSLIFPEGLQYLKCKSKRDERAKLTLYDDFNLFTFERFSFNLLVCSDDFPLENSLRNLKTVRCVGELMLKKLHFPIYLRHFFQLPVTLSLSDGQSSLTFLQLMAMLRVI